MPYHQGLLPQRRQSDDLGGLLDPNIVKRGMLLPFGRTKQGEMEFAVPEILLSLARSARLPGRVAQGYPFKPEDVTEMAMNVAGTGYLGGGLLTGGVPRGAVLGANVWHGGPNRWMPEPGFPQGRPLLSRVGTGEGAGGGGAAYGHGFYSADAKGVAKEYQKNLSANVVEGVDPKKYGVDAATADKLADRWLIYKHQANDKDIEWMRPNMDPATPEGAIALDVFDGKIKRGTEGSLKKLDLPDEDVAKMLDWDAPLSEQPKALKAIIERLSREVGGDMDKMISANGQLRTGVTAESFYRTLSKELGSKPAASEALRKAGIPGLKYYDQMSRAPVKDTKYLNRLQTSLGNAERAGRTADAATIKEMIRDLQKEVPNPTRNYVTWDQDVLNRTKILAQ
jgi:hypothetical protein